MIDKIKHFALTSLPTVHDEEALTALELMGRMGVKVNEAIEQVNENSRETLEMKASIPTIVEEEIEAQIQDEFDQIYEKVNNLIEQIPTGEGANIRPGVVQNGSIVSGMLGVDMLELRQNHYLVMAGKWNGGQGYYDQETLQFVTHASYNVSDLIPVSYGQYYKIHTAIFGGLVHPVAFFDNSGRCVGVAGAPGNSSWDLVTHEIAIDRGDITHMRVLCGTTYTSQMRVELYTLKDFSINEINLATREHWHMHAKKRTNTVTDRAQVKCTFRLPPDFTEDDTFRISVGMAKYANIAESGTTVRVFASVNPDAYDLSLPETAAGYAFLRSRSLDVFDLKVPIVVNGDPTAYVTLFFDLIPEDGNEYMDAWIIPPVLERVSTGQKIKAINPAIHGGMETDTLNIVRPGAAVYGAYRKKILGLGDSLMKGNTLSKSYSWFNIAAGALDMDHRNAAANGMPLATPTTGETSIASIAASNLDSFKPDYVIVQGGANDKRLNVPLENFRTAISSIITNIRFYTPKAKILFATNWHRTDDANALGLFDWEYVDAMLEECEKFGVPCINNYAEGLDLTNGMIANWADEGKVSTGTANIHFSIEGNKWIAEKYIHAIGSL